MEEIIENDNSLNNETTETDSGATETTVDVAALQKKVEEYENTNRQLFERAKKAEGFVKVDGKWVKAPKPEEAIETKNKLDATTGELSETQLDYLDLKGITHEEDIEIIQKVMKRTGQTVRQALADDYVQAKLEKAKQAREVQNAMPSSTRRSGQTETNDVDYWLNKNAATGELPTDFELRAKVIDAKMSKQSDNTPPWRK